MDELQEFGTIVLVVAGGFSLALLTSKLTERFPVPAPALFLLAARLFRSRGRFRGRSAMATG